MLKHYSYNIWFKVCRPARVKYNLSTNCLLMLNACYCYNTAVSKPFTVHQILQFTGYYNYKTLRVYLKVLIDKEFIDIVFSRGSIPYYSITSKGMEVISVISNSYDIQLAKFCQQYNISL